MKPINIATELSEAIVYNIDTPWDSIDMTRLLPQEIDNIVDNLESKLENDLEFRLGDTMVNVVMEDIECI